jgi:D-alanyl-D-alanine carboxypeptidase
MNPRRNRIVGAVVVGALALGGVAYAQSGDGELPQSLIDALTPLARYPHEHGIPGSITYVEVAGLGRWMTTDGRSAAAVGSAPISPDSVFGIGSITKTFTATAVLRLIADGSYGLTLDDTLSSFDTVPDLPNDDEITVAQLLQHTSGIADFGSSTTFACTILPGCGPQDYAPGTDFAPSTLVELAAAQAPFGPPGRGSAAFHYSNTNYVILGMILEEVTGRTAEAVITAEVIEPLDLDDTVFPTSVDEAASLLTTRPSLVLTDAGKVVKTDVYPVFNPSAYWTAGGIVSTAGDLARWVEALAWGRLLPLPLQLRRLQTVIVGEFAPLPGLPGKPIVGRYGLGIADFGGYLGHNGAVPGYQSIALYEPETRTTVVMLLNAWIYEIGNENGQVTITGVDFEMPTDLFPSFVAVLARHRTLPRTR